MQKKLVEIECDGYKWNFNASEIAHNYASYCENKNNQNYFDCFERMINNDSELKFWFITKMNLEDISGSLVLISSPPAPKYPVISNSNIKIINQDFS